MNDGKIIILQYILNESKIDEINGSILSKLTNFIIILQRTSNVISIINNV